MNTQIINELLSNLLENYNFKTEDGKGYDFTGHNLEELTKQLYDVDTLLLEASRQLNDTQRKVQSLIQRKKDDIEWAKKIALKAEAQAKEEAKEEAKRQYKKRVARFNPARLIELPEIIVDEIATYLSTKQEVKRWKRTFFNGGYNDEYCPRFKWTYEWGRARRHAINLKWQNDYLEQAVLTLTRMAVPDLKLMFKKFKCLGHQGNKQELVEQLIHKVTSMGKTDEDDYTPETQDHRMECLTLIMAGRKLAQQKNKGCVLVKEDKEKNAEAKQGWMYIDERTKLDADRYNH